MFALFALAVGAIYLLGPDPPHGPDGTPLIGHVDHVVDGDTLDVAGQRVRLVGLDAPELAQTCQTATGEKWACGSMAKARLRDLVRGQEVRCSPSGRDRYDRLLATCLAGDVDLAAALVGEGLAVGTGYLAEQARAKSQRLGIWQGAFVLPSTWRETEGRAGGTAAGNPSRFDRFVAWLMGLFGN